MNRRQLVLVATVAVVVLLAGLALLVGLARSDGTSGDNRRTITVTGTGVVKAVPDVAEVSLGVSATAKTARAARAASAARMNRVLAALKARGLAAADIQTSQVSLSPNFGPTGARVVGYTARNTVTARIRDLDAAGAVIAAAAGVGANEISGPSLIVSNEKLVYEKALKAAAVDARAHARAIASANGETVGEMRSASEGSENVPLAIEASSKAYSSATPVEPGTVEVQANVTATFEVDD